MTDSKSRDGPGTGTHEGGARHIFAGTTANSPGRPERIPQLAAFNIYDAGHKQQSCPPSGGDLADRDVLLYDSGWHPGVYISEERTMVFELPDRGLRSKTIDDVFFGVWNLPPENNSDLDLNPSGVRVPPSPPVLEGGAAVQIEEMEPALVG